MSKNKVAAAARRLIEKYGFLRAADIAGVAPGTLRTALGKQRKMQKKTVTAILRAT